ncbi:MAG: PIN/TRAM domain-containing protein [Planctomycetota bacterium]|nr:MAG: PIN/TRAM domain-containing protein [Planctomycetota bacterium]
MAHGAARTLAVAMPHPRTSDEFVQEQRQRQSIVRVLRVVVLFLMAAVTVLAALQIGSDPNDPGALQFRWAADWWFPLIIAVAMFALTLTIDLATPKKKLSTITGMFFGVLVGLIAAVAVGVLIELIARTYNLQGERTVQLLATAKVLIGIGLCYLGASIVLQTQDDFRLVIPYVEFAKQIRGVRPLILDTSALIDGRVLKLATTELLQAPLIVPRFVVEELHRLADSGDESKRLRGRKGLDAVARLQRTRSVEVTIDETTPPGKSVDEKLVELARMTPGALVTTDSGLERLAKINKTPVVNLHTVAAALKPARTVGERVVVKLIKPGEQPGQGVGYLDDGAMIVAEDGASHIGQEVELTITGSVQTSAGRLFFGRVQGPAPAAPAPRPAPQPSTAATTSEGAAHRV